MLGARIRAPRSSVSPLTRGRTLANEFVEGCPTWRSVQLANIIQHAMKQGKEKRTSYLICICGTGVMRIYLLRCRTLVEADKALQKILARGAVVSTTCVVREIVAQRGSGKFLGEQINLIKEQDLMTVCGVKCWPRQSDIALTIDVLTNHRELHIESNSVSASCMRFCGEIGCYRRKPRLIEFWTYHTLIFVQHLVVFTERDQKDEGSDVLKTVNPLFPLASLTSDIE